MTANAESCIEESKRTTLLPLNPVILNEVVLSLFWVDNFDLTTDTQYGGGALNITTLMAFQEGQAQDSQNVNVSVPRKASRRLSSEDPSMKVTRRVDQQMVPPTTNMYIVPEKFNFDDTKFMTSYIMWIYARRENSFDQIVPIFSGFQTKIRTATGLPIRKTVATYLPPINSKVLTHFL